MQEGTWVESLSRTIVKSALWRSLEASTKLLLLVSVVLCRMLSAFAQLQLFSTAALSGATMLGLEKARDTTFVLNTQ